MKSFPTLKFHSLIQENEVNLWKWETGSTSTDQDEEPTQVFEPQLMASFNHGFGDVNEIQFLTNDLLAIASSDGTVTLLKTDVDNFGGFQSSFKFSKANQWTKLHSSCNSLGINGENILTVGKEGKMHILNGRRSNPIRSFDNADSGYISDAIFIKQEQAVSANGRGQVKVWDLRNGTETPTKVCHLAMDLVGVTSLTKHPTQPHVVVGGCSNGVLAFWDLRGQPDYPLSVVKAHSDAISEVQFHEQQPDHLFSCSQSGDTWHWNGSNATKNPNSILGGQAKPLGSTNCFWLNSELVKNRVDTKPLMANQALPINSMSILGSSVLVAGDAEVIFYIADVGI